MFDYLATKKVQVSYLRAPFIFKFNKKSPVMKNKKIDFYISIITFLAFILMSCEKDANINNSLIIEISPHLSDNSFVFEDAFESIEIIPLETRAECLIGGITRLIEANDNFFILDEKNNIVVRFDSEGKFVTKIGVTGNGPGEYLKIEDFIVDKKNQLIKLYDIRSRKIIIYDFNGSFIKEFRIDAFLNSVVNAEDGYYFGFVGNITNSNEIQGKNQGELKFIKFDEKGKIVDKVFGHKHSKIQLAFFEHISPQQDGSISFVEPLQNQIFKFKNGEIHPYYSIKFNCCSLPNDIQEILNQSRTPETVKQKNAFSEANKNYILGFIKFFENDNWIILQYSVKYRFQFAIFHKTSGKIFESSGLPMSKVNANLFFTPCYIDDEFVYSSSSAFYLHERYNEEQKNNKIGKERIRSWKMLLENIDVNDNPIIFKYKLPKTI